MRERFHDDDDDVYYYVRWRPKLEGETENMGVCTEERKGGTAEVLMATPCTNFSNFIHWVVEVGGTRMRMCGAQALLEGVRRFLVGSGRPSMLMRSAAALATMRSCS